MVTITAMEAQSRFGQLLNTVQREPVTITQHGRVAAFMVSPQDMQELQAARLKRVNALAAVEKLFTKNDAKLRPAAHKLNDAEITELVRGAR